MSDEQDKDKALRRIQKYSLSMLASALDPQDNLHPERFDKHAHNRQYCVSRSSHASLPCVIMITFYSGIRQPPIRCIGVKRMDFPKAFNHEEATPTISKALNQLAR
jgi:hypothetical protein